MFQRNISSCLIDFDRAKKSNNFDMDWHCFGSNLLYVIAMGWWAGLETFCHTITRWKLTQLRSSGRCARSRSSQLGNCSSKKKLVTEVSHIIHREHSLLAFGASKAKPLSSGWCENRKFGTSQLRNSFWYVAVAQFFLVRRGCTILFGMSRLCNTLPYMECSLHCAIVWGLSRICTIVYHLWYVSKVSYACLLQLPL